MNTLGDILTWYSLASMGEVLTYTFAYCVLSLPILIIFVYFLEYRRDRKIQNQLPSRYQPKSRPR